MRSQANCHLAAHAQFVHRTIIQTIPIATLNVLKIYGNKIRVTKHEFLLLYASKCQLLHETMTAKMIVWLHRRKHTLHTILSHFHSPNVIASYEKFMLGWFSVQMPLYMFVCVCVCVRARACVCIWLMKKQFFITHTVCQTEIPGLLEQLGHKHNFCQNVVSTKQNVFFSLYFRKNITSLLVGLLGLGSFLSVFYKTVCRWVYENLLFHEYTPGPCFTSYLLF